MPRKWTEADIRHKVTEDGGNFVFTLRQTGIAKKGHDEMTLEMFAFICNAYIDLQGGEIRQSDLDESEATVQFAIPK